MKDQSYFSFFPTTVYNGHTIQNLLLNIQVNELTKKYHTVFIPYQIQEDQTRPEHVAWHYYKNSKLDWLILFVNKFIDPFFDWPLDTNSFNELVKSKYNSIETSQITNDHYKVDMSILPNITPSVYASLSAELKKYWKPVWNDIVTTINIYKPLNPNWKLTSDGYNLLSVNEKTYWQAVSKYDYEFEKNEDKRIIRLLDKMYLNQFLSEFKTLLKN